ncbi:RNA polymerase sigma factor [Fulvivirgaceae bacterium BMA10]|uniref:RNA polymerase sigma factor n=1 Tax=Splendidivirga corallicola TaxID=3051826 RepID=A0ABT8KW44_9BACT|nr:RNA polymerase sigma factor [Fulvivirgaceae bacterium BMA10]
MTALEFNHQIINLRNTLKLYTRRFTLDQEESNDLLQDTILKALTHREKFRPNTNFKAWLYTIMKNTFINNYRRNVKAKMQLDDTKDLYYLNVTDNHTFSSPISKLEYKEMKAIISSLKDIYRIPFQLYIKGFKYQEISEELNVPLGTVKTRIFYARQMLMDRIRNN